MPIFEYQCQQCAAKVTLLMGVVAEPDHKVCPHCGSRELRRLISRFRRGRTEDERMDEMADRMDNQGEPDSYLDTREVLKEMGRALDDDMSEEMEQMFEDDMESGAEE